MRIGKKTLEGQGRNNVYGKAIITEHFIKIHHSCEYSIFQNKTSDIKEHCEFAIMENTLIAEITQYRK